MRDSEFFGRGYAELSRLRNSAAGEVFQISRDLTRNIVEPAVHPETLRDVFGDLITDELYERFTNLVNG